MSLFYRGGLTTGNPRRNLNRFILLLLALLAVSTIALTNLRGSAGVTHAAPLSQAEFVVASGAFGPFVPNLVTINVGESVQWDNGAANGIHNVVADDSSFTNGPPSTASWTFVQQFNSPGTFLYFCVVHGTAGGGGMSGTIIVQAIVPDVVGLPQADAEAAIVGAGLTVGTVGTANSDTVPAGDVISQDPTGGNSVAPLTPVDLVVSLGPATVLVPDVVGLPQADAEAAIVGAGLTVGTVGTANSDTVPAGDVISQDPTAGNLVAPGSAVDLVVSLGPAPDGEIPPAVGGATSFLDGGSGASVGYFVALVGSITSILTIFLAGGWYARRRWLRNS